MTMRRFKAWLWKEAREHRGVLLGVFVAIPLAVAAAFFALGERLEFEQVDLFPAIAVALPFVAVGFDLFSRELRRGTHALVLRTPGALATSLAAKLLVLLLAVGVAVALEEATRSILTATTGLPRTTRFVVTSHLENGEPVRGWERVRHDPVQGLPASLLYALWVGLAGVWATLASTWLSRGPATSGIGIAWIGALAGPWIYLAASRPWFWEPFAGRHVPYLAGIAALGLLATAYAWLRGRRFLAAGGAAAVRGMAVTLAVAVVGYATAGTAYARWVDVTPESPELSIDRGILGVGGHRLFLNVHRGENWAYRHWFDPNRDERKGTPPLPWCVDVESGDWHAIGELGESSDAPEELRGRRTIQSLPWVVVTPVNPVPPGRAERWYSGRDGSLRLRVGPEDGRTAVLPLLREEAAAMTPVRDAKGRRAWILFGHVEREGDAPTPQVPDPGPYGHNPFLIPGGWIVAPDFARHDRVATTLDADTGVVRRAAVQGRPLRRTLDPRRGLVYDDDLEDAPDDAPERTWRTADLETQTLGAPLHGLTPATTLEVVAPDVVLGVRPGAGAEDSVELVLWDPLRDQDSVLPLEGEPSVRLTAAVSGFLGAADGRALVRVFRGPLVRPERSRHATWAPPPQGLNAWVVVDPVKRTARRLTSWTTGVLNPVAFEPSGTFLAIEDQKHVVRFGPGLDERTVVFPRPAAGN